MSPTQVTALAEAAVSVSSIQVAQVQGLGSAATQDGTAFADADHNHDADYSPLGHTHSYATEDHGHTGDEDGDQLSSDAMDQPSVWRLAMGAAESSHNHDERYRRTVQSEDGDPVRTICQNTTTEETALSYTIPAGTLATHDVAFEIDCDVLQNHGSTVNHGMRVYLGGTQIFSGSGNWSNNDPDRFNVWMKGALSQRGATNKQRVRWNAWAAVATSAGGQWINSDQRGSGANFGSEDATTDLLLEVKFRWTSTQSNGDVRVFKTQVELVPR